MFMTVQRDLGLISVHVKVLAGVVKPGFLKATTTIISGNQDSARSKKMTVNQTAHIRNH